MRFGREGIEFASKPGLMLGKRALTDDLQPFHSPTSFEKALSLLLGRGRMKLPLLQEGTFPGC